MAAMIAYFSNLVKVISLSYAVTVMSEMSCANNQNKLMFRCSQHTLGDVFICSSFAHILRTNSKLHSSTVKWTVVCCYQSDGCDMCTNNNLTAVLILP